MPAIRQPPAVARVTSTAFHFLTSTSTTTYFAGLCFKLSDYASRRNEHTFKRSYRPLTSIEARTAMAAPKDAKPASRGLVVRIKELEQQKKYLITQS